MKKHDFNYSVFSAPDGWRVQFNEKYPDGSVECRYVFIKRYLRRKAAVGAALKISKTSNYKVLA